jgi:hypothetical protein
MEHAFVYCLQLEFHHKELNCNLADLRVSVGLREQLILPVKILNIPLGSCWGIRLASDNAVIFFRPRRFMSMRKILTFVLALASLGFIGSASETKGNAITKTNPQVQIRIGRRRHYERDRYRREYDNRYRENGYGIWNTTETKIVHDGWRTYRETYQVRHFPNGQTQWVLISRDRVY